MSKENDSTPKNNPNVSNIGNNEWTHKTDVQIKTSLAIFGGLLATIIVAWILAVPLGGIMATIQGTFLYHFIPFLMSIITFGLLAYRAYIKKIKGLVFLSSGVFLYSISELLAVISNPTGTILNRGGNTLAMIADLLFPVAVILLYLHIELTDKIRPSLSHAIGIIGTATPLVIGGLFVTIFEGTTNEFIIPIVEEIRKIVFVYLGIFALIILWISLFAFRVMYGTLKHADSAEVALSSSLVLVAFSSMIANFVLLGLNYSNVLFSEELLLSDMTIHNTYLTTFALITIIAAYIQSPEFSYAIPFDCYQLVAIQKDIGVTLFSFINEIRSDSGQNTHDALQSATIVAIQNLVQEIAAAEGNIMIIGMEDRIIVFRSRNELVTVLITERSSYFLNDGLEAFTHAFYEEFEDEIKDFSGQVDIFSNANKLIRRHLPFMRKESLH